MYGEYVLLIRGCYVGESVGGHPYQPNNPKTNYSDTLESTAAEALRRIAGKRLSCGSQVWNPEYARQWVAKNAVRSQGKWEKRMGAVKMPQDAPAPQTAITPHPEPTNTPQAKETHPKAVYANDSTRAWMIQRLEACRREATEYFQKCDQLLDTEGLEDLPLRFVPIDGKQMLALTKAIGRFAVGDPAEVAFEPNQEKVATAGKVEVPQQPELSPEWFWDIMCPIPHKGEKRDAYLKNPDTIRSLYDAIKGGAKEAQDRLFGFANRWKPEARTVGDKTYQPSAADLKFREALDAFIRWEIEHNKPLVAEEV